MFYRKFCILSRTRSDQGLHCLQMSLLWDVGINELNCFDILEGTIFMINISHFTQIIACLPSITRQFSFASCKCSWDLDIAVFVFLFVLRF